jgi:hypothetical protein
MWPQEKTLYVIKIIKRSFRIVMCPNANGTNFRGITSHSSAKDLQTRKSKKANFACRPRCTSTGQLTGGQ